MAPRQTPEELHFPLQPTTVVPLNFRHDVPAGFQTTGQPGPEPLHSLSALQSLVELAVRQIWWSLLWYSASVGQLFEVPSQTSGLSQT